MFRSENAGCRAVQKKVVCTRFGKETQDGDKGVTYSRVKILH